MTLALRTAPRTFTLTATEPTDHIAATREQLAALLVPHADVIAARWDAVAHGRGPREVATAHELLGSHFSFEADTEPAPGPS
ncbi:hypothetical protein [Streptomyces sp. NPDC029674]|uniref:hypothetical protein n=1 Tax=Streptomyces sp. NPDC029674 TaxID=3365297 RepID=UPI0038516A2B